MTSPAAATTIPLTDTNRMVRDTFSKGLLSVDKAGLGAYRAQRKSSEQLRILEQDINTIQNELAEVKELLKATLKGPHE